jgi:3-phenylpropionate/cinnamic acid dioxygenase small subunit
MFDDWLAVNHLLMTYAERVDGGRWGELGELFEHATYRIEHAETGDVSVYEGAGAVRAFGEQTIVYDDGTPRTKHVITNVDIRIDGDVATSSCNATVFQQVDDFPLQPIAAGRYLDRFEKVDGTWRFAERTITGFLQGDRSRHIKWVGGNPE